MSKQNYPKTEKCRVPGCKRNATIEVILYDFYDNTGTPFFERDSTCPFLCAEHAIENEHTAVGSRGPKYQKHKIKYRYTKKRPTTGFSVYLPLNGQYKMKKECL